MDLAEVADGAEVRPLIADDGQEGQIASQAAATRRLEKTPMQ